MSLISELSDIEAILGRTLDNLLLTIGSATDSEKGQGIRHQVGRVRARFAEFFRDGTFSEEFLSCFTLVREANASLISLAYVRTKLFEEEPKDSIATAMVQTAIVFCLSAESRLITAIEFTSRDDVEAMMAAMKIAFDQARELAADVIDSSSYQALTYLAGALTNYLATTARPLPRMVKFVLPLTLPSLALSQRLYYDATRSDELIAENKIVHPAFCMREIRGLSA